MRAAKAAERGETYIPAETPKVVSYNLWLWESFIYLSSARSVSERGPDPIAISEIHSMSLFHGITESDKLLEFLYIMTKLDSKFMTHMRDKLQKQREKQERKAKSKSGKR